MLFRSMKVVLELCLYIPRRIPGWLPWGRPERSGVFERVSFLRMLGFTEYSDLIAEDGRPINDAPTKRGGENGGREKTIGLVTYTASTWFSLLVLITIERFEPQSPASRVRAKSADVPCPLKRCVYWTSVARRRSHALRKHLPHTGGYARLHTNDPVRSVFEAWQVYEPRLLSIVLSSCIRIS